MHCTNCGARINDTARFCAGCGFRLDHAAEVSGGISINVDTLLGMAKTAEIGGNNEEAHGYFNRVLEMDPANAEAWIGKGKAAAWQSTLFNIRLREALISFQHAIANAPEDQKIAVTNEVLGYVNEVVVALYGIARSQMIEYISLDNSWPDYLNQVSQLLGVLDEVVEWNKSYILTLDNIIYLCKDNIEGYNYRDEYNNNIPSVHHVNNEYEKLLRGMMERSAEIIRENDPNYLLPNVTKKEKDACFVVTATMGDFNHPDVVYLRLFRDEWLRKRSLGAVFIRIYYCVGPLLAGLIGRSNTLRKISHSCIVKPAIRAAVRRFPRM